MFFKKRKGRKSKLDALNEEMRILSSTKEMLENEKDRLDNLISLDESDLEQTLELIQSKEVLVDTRIKCTKKEISELKLGEV